MACQITNNSNIQIDGFEDMIQSLVSFSQDRLGFENPPSLFLNSDPKNGSNPLGRTAYYDPSTQEVHIFVDGRHPKDIMRSISHELVHHKQNMNGDLDGDHYHGEGYAQKDAHMRKMEKQAYLEGNMNFRDWEDGYKQNETIYNEWRTNQMSLKEWKNKELFTLLSNKWGFGKNTITEEKIGEMHCGKRDDEMNEDPNMPIDAIKKYLIKKGVSKEKLDSMTKKEMDALAAEERLAGGEEDVALEEDLEEEKKLSDDEIAALEPQKDEITQADILKMRGADLKEGELELYGTGEKEEADLKGIESISEEDDRDEELRHKDAAMDDFARMAKLHKDMVYDTYKKHEDELLGHKEDSERYDDAERDDAAHMDYLGKDAHDDREAREDEEEDLNESIRRHFKRLLK
tara:strand:- start:452 stop:1660 length:1209 start_codon:yes stop_codon:yes gene_type:complete